MTYTYLGDRLTSPTLKGQLCQAVRRPDGKCIRGRNGSMLVSFSGTQVVVIARLLRKSKNQTSPAVSSHLVQNCNTYENSTNR